MSTTLIHLYLLNVMVWDIREKIYHKQLLSLKMENFLLGLLSMLFRTNWFGLNGGVGVSYLDDGESAAEVDRSAELL